ncbi:laccase domain-containing protein [Peptostreptococcus anaerobius]|nr:laccase domain-containing protein [Peptostreptococcus anaerobius]MDK8277978.1 laccase domain-containing protein [Peptostreptococcus anaerobius]
MLALGVKSENINKLNICTVENSDLFYSYRAHNKTDKRIGTIIEIL